MGAGARGEEATGLIRALAEAQHGAVARRQLLAAGLGKGLVQDRVRSGLLLPVHRGVYAVGHRRADMPHRWMAAVLACGERAVISHASAAQLWGLRGSAGPVVVTRASGGTTRRGIRVVQAELAAEEVDRERGIPVTSVERTLLDNAARLDRRQLERLVAAADRSGRLRWPCLREVVERGRNRPGAGRLRRVASEIDPRAVEARSGLEVDFLARCREAGLPTPAVNVLAAGRMVDFLWPAERVVVEVDSYRYHGDRGAFERDHRSTLALEAAGYTVHRVTDRMLEADPEPFLAHVGRSLRRAAGNDARS